MPAVPRSRSRVLLVGAVLAVAVAAGLALRPGGPAEVQPPRPAPQDRPGPVLLVPGYGGSAGSLETLAQTLRGTGRQVTVLQLPGNGTEDLRASAAVLQAAAEAALAAGAPSVDVVGYSAGGLVARLWARADARQARRVVTIGSPHHGTRLAAMGAAYDPGSCPAACLQMVPGSDLLEELNDGDETPDGPRWLSLWTTQDTVVTPPESARLDGAINLSLQQLCPGLQVDHSSLPTSPVVAALVQQALSGADLVRPTACPA